LNTGSRRLLPFSSDDIVSSLSALVQPGQELGKIDA
jgi:hypothetical protein